MSNCLVEGYAVLLKGYLIWMNLPWVVMGIGCTVGGVPTVLHFFRPRDGNPFVLAWYCTVFIIWAGGTFWLFLRNGAEELARHPGLIEFRYGFKKKDIASPVLIKVLWLVMLAGGIIAFVAVWTHDIPVGLKI